MMARKVMIDDIVKALNKASYGLIRIIWSALGCNKGSSDTEACPPIDAQA